MDRDIGGGRRAALRQLLEYQRRVEPRQLRAAHVLAHIEAAEAERGGLAHAFDREDVLLVPLARMGRHFRLRELARGVADRALFLG